MRTRIFVWFPKKCFSVVVMIALFGLLSAQAVQGETVKIGLNYPKTGPYSVQGLDQLRGAELAMEEINAEGGILGKSIEIVTRDTVSKPDIAVKNANELIDTEGVKMIFGGVSSGVAVAVGEVCQQKGMLFMGTVTASNETTGEKGHRHTFRACYNAWMGAKAMSAYLKKNFEGKKYFYVVSDYTWGWSSEASIRKFTGTEDQEKHKRVLTALGADEETFKKAITLANMVKPDVLVLVLFGKDMSTAIRLATMAGVKKTMQIVVPILELGLAEGGGPKVMEGVIGTADFNWQVPYKYNYSGGKAFVEKFTTKYNRYPCWGAATAYTNLIQYRDAVKRAGGFEVPKVIKALEGHKFTLLKDQQTWQDFDHQCVQSVYIVKCKPEDEVMKDKFKLDYFEILDKQSGEELVETRAEWNQRRQAANVPTELEKLPGE